MILILPPRSLGMGGCQSNQDAEEDHRAVGAYREGTNDADDAAAVLEEASG